MSFSPALVITGLTLIILIIFFSYLIYLFNVYITLKNLISKSQANIDVLLKQRFDELPKLIEAVKGYMKYEYDILNKLTNIRAQIMSTSMENKATYNDQISNAINSIFAVAENYPELKANQSFLQLQGRISAIESEISGRREFYNETVNNYNVWVQSFPNRIIANILKAEKKELFIAAGTQDIKVRF